MSAPVPAPPAPPAGRAGWLFSPAIDLLVFGGTAALSLLVVLLAPHLGVGGVASPEWSWIVGVLLVDVAHVWSTVFVVYLDPFERQRRPRLYALVPLGCYLVGLVGYQLGADVFWRGVAYLAIFHFVRQQWGWVALYRARHGERDRLGRWIDAATVYAATVYPLIVWHTELPRAFWWMREGDLATGLPATIADVAGVMYLAIGAAYLARAGWQAWRGQVAWGKHVVVLTTAACWYVGIVATNSDFAFTVTNVFIHGVPYLVLVFVYARTAARVDPRSRGLGARIVQRGALAFLATCWALAYVEELLWDRMVWHDRTWLFGLGDEFGDGVTALLVPLLIVPQLTHYVLDAFLWRRAANPRLGLLLAPGAGAQAGSGPAGP